MAKIVITAALFLAMVAMASAYTTITTVVEEEDNTRSRGGDCQKQLTEQQHLRMCKMYLQEASPYAEESIEMEANPMRMDPQQFKSQCCTQLGNMDEECRCQALRTMSMERQQGSRQMGDMSRMAMELPRMCGMEPRQC